MSGQNTHFYEFGEFRLDTGERRLLHNGDPVALPPKVYDTLLVLVESRGRTVEKEQLMNAVWPDIFVEEANLTVNISALRKALGEGGAERRYIETVPKRGYRFVPTVTEIKEETADPPVEDPGSRSPLVEEPGGRKAKIRRVRNRFFLRFGLSVGIFALLVGLSIIAVNTWVRRAAPGPKVRSIAVLPFKPLVADSRDEPLEMGLCDALITRLGGLNQLVVRPTSSVVMYNKLGQDPLAAGRELGVDALLDGYVQRSGDRIRVTAQLLSIVDGKHLWSGQFNEDFTGIFGVEDSISEKMVEALRLNLTGEEQRRVTRHYTEDVEAYQLYIKGRYFQDKRNTEGLRKSIEYFQQTTKQDPNYALAFAGLADSYIYLAIRADIHPEDSRQRAKAAASRALEIDDALAEAHASMGNVRYWYDWDLPAAESEFKRAIELSVNNPMAHQFYAPCLIAMGRRQEAISEIKRSQGLSPLSLPINVQVARILFFAREYDEAIEQCRKTLEMDPNFAGARLFMGRAYKEKRMYNEALAELHRARDLLGDSAEVFSLIGYTYAVSGRSVEARRVLQEMLASSKERYASPYHLAMVYAGIGEQSKALDWLDKAYADREGRMTLLQYAPEFNSLHADPRFQDLVRRVGMAR